MFQPTEMSLSVLCLYYFNFILRHIVFACGVAKDNLDDLFYYENMPVDVPCVWIAYCVLFIGHKQTTFPEP